jgi:ribosomal protein S18 acetylase RimI-like enzyme
MSLQILHELPVQYRAYAAALLYEAFRRKLDPAGQRSILSRTLIEKHLRPDLTTIALVGDQVMGVAGLKYQGQRFLAPRLRDHLAHFGRWRGLIQWYYYVNVFAGMPPADALMIDALAVSSAARGQGIGTALIEAVCVLAQRRHCRSVCLDVVNTNPQARRLYERLGFQVAYEGRVPHLWVLGFTRYARMVRTL